MLVDRFPYSECEIPYICKEEMACTVEDVLTLRTRLAYLDKEAALTAAPKVADLMAKTLKWSRAQNKCHLQQALEVVSNFGGRVPNDNTSTK